MTHEWPLASFLDRWFGDFCDGLVVLGVAGAAYVLIDRPLVGPEADFMNDEHTTAAVIAALLWFLWNWTYLVGSTGQSWGRRIAGLKVVNAGGEPIGFWRALGRNLVALYVSAPLFYLGFLWVLWDRRRQAWHDKLFGAYVVRSVVT